MGKDLTKAMSVSAPYTMAILIIGFGIGGYFIAKKMDLQGAGTALLVLIGVLIGFGLSLYDLIISNKLEERKLQKELKEQVKVEALQEILKEKESGDDEEIVEDSG